MTTKRDALKNSIKQLALLRAKLKGTTYAQELVNLKLEMEKKLLIDESSKRKSIRFDPELFARGVELCESYFESGTMSFIAFSQSIIADIGIDIKPYLKSIYNAVRDFPGIDVSGMTSYDEVSKINIEDIEGVQNPI